MFTEMLKKVYILIVVALVSAFTVSGQEMKFVAGVNGSAILPAGILSQRFEPAIGYSVYFGKQINERWTWTGNLLYYKFDKMREENLKKMIQAEINGVTNDYSIPLPGLEMEMEIAGLMAEAKMNVFRTGYMETDLNFGFGFLYWEHQRGEYYDSLYVTPPEGGDPVLVDELEVPGRTQTDWSGAFNIGAEINFPMIEMLALNLSANYKLVVGEIWPTLSLGLENVSGFQMFDLRAGLQFRF